MLEQQRVGAAAGPSSAKLSHHAKSIRHRTRFDSAAIGDGVYRNPVFGFS